MSKPSSLARRFGFGALHRAFVPAEEVSRLSLVWWKHGLDDPSPVFGGSEARPTTLVARWPADDEGRICPERVHEARVLRWTMTANMFVELGQLHEDFHLGRHDLLVGGPSAPRLVPCSESIYRLARERKQELSAVIERAVAQALYRAGAGDP